MSYYFSPLSRKYKAWIFDMDGTLTRSIHDFDGFKDEMGLDCNQPILEGIQALPLHQKQIALNKLEAWERELALLATPSSGCIELLNALLKQECHIGIVTRNTKTLARVTLKACGLDVYFEDRYIIGRDCASPKPDPDGCQRLLSEWNVSCFDSIMVGDHLFDIMAGKNAGMKTIYLGADEEGSKRADLSIDTLEKLLS